MQNLAYPADYLITYPTNFDKNFTLIDIWVGMIKLTFVLRSLKGRCYGNQLLLLVENFFSNDEPDNLQSLLWRSETECNIVM